MTPGGVRLGTPAVTTRGLLEKDMDVIAEFLHRIALLSAEAQKKGGKNLKQFVVELEKDKNLEALAKEVEDFSKQFYIPGVNIQNMKYNH